MAMQTSATHETEFARDSVFGYRTRICPLRGGKNRAALPPRMWPPELADLRPEDRRLLAALHDTQSRGRRRVSRRLRIFRRRRAESGLLWPPIAVSQRPSLLTPLAKLRRSRRRRGVFDPGRTQPGADRRRSHVARPPRS